MEAIEAIMTRRSVRKFLDSPVERWKRDKILEAALSAPSAKNFRPCRFLVIEDRKILSLLSEKLTEAGQQSDVFEKAPLAVAVCADLRDYPTGSSAWLEDCAAAMENMMIASAALGLGSLWFGVYRRAEKERAVRESLRTPDHIQVQAIAVIGYGAEKPQKREDLDKNPIRYLTWNEIWRD